MSSKEVSSLLPGQWAAEQFGSADFGDARLTHRAVKVAAAMASDPEGSIPRQNKTWKQTKGAYRLFDADEVSYEAMVEPHWRQTRERAGFDNFGRLSAGKLTAGGEDGGVVLFVQDTTELNYSAHPQTSGLGRFGKGPLWKSGQGMLLHHALAVRPGGEDGVDVPRVLGLAWGKLWCRAAWKQRGKSRWKRPADSESQRWTETVDAIGAPPVGSGTTWVHVGDREADLFELYERCTSAPGLAFVVRVTQPRNAAAGHAMPVETVRWKDRPVTKLTEVARAMAPLAGKTLVVAGNDRQPTRRAELKVSAGAVTVCCPWNRSRRGHALRLWDVRVWEPDPPVVSPSNPPAGNDAEPARGEPVEPARGELVEPIEWILLTNLPDADGNSALRLASWYALRWTIEEYHKCLKTGCRVEQRQLETAKRLRPLIGMSSVVAVRLLQLKHDVRREPDRPARRCVPEAQVRTLANYLRSRGGKRISMATMSVRQFAHEVAKLGGFVGRKADGEPGWLTLWRGWHELELMTLGYHLSRASERYG